MTNYKKLFEDIDYDKKILLNKLKSWDYTKYDIWCTVGKKLSSSSINMQHYLFRCRIKTNELSSNKIKFLGFDKYYIDKHRIDIYKASVDELRKSIVKVIIDVDLIDSISFIRPNSEFEIRTRDSMVYKLTRFQPDTNRERGDKGEKFIKKYSDVLK